MEKQNKTVRQKRKKEDMARIRTLVGIVADSLIMAVIEELPVQSMFLFWCVCV